MLINPGLIDFVEIMRIKTNLFYIAGSFYIDDLQGTEVRGNINTFLL